MPIYALGEKEPQIAESAYIHPDAVVIGDVALGEGASVWPGAVLRGDFGRIVIGGQTSIQDGTLVHAGEEIPTVVGARCVVGHGVHLEGCVVDEDCLIGSMSTLLHRARIRSGTLVAAGALVTNDVDVPERSLVMGVPARVVRTLDDDSFMEHVDDYVELAKKYRNELRVVG